MNKIEEKESRREATEETAMYAFRMFHTTYVDNRLYRKLIAC